MSLTLIAAMTWPERVIGAGNAIPWRLGADLRRFKEMTLGHPVVMGRKTWESLPFKLPGRTNVVLSGNLNTRLAGNLAAQGITTKSDKVADYWAQDLDDALRKAGWKAGRRPDDDKAEVFVIGGAQLYAQTLPFADRLALTLIHHPFAGDARFPAWDAKDWTEVSRQKNRHDGDPSFDYEFWDLKFLDLKRSRPQGEA